MMRLCYTILVVVFACSDISAMIAEKVDYQRADTLYKLADKVYSAKVIPEWIGDSYYFWYKNKERSGTVFYLVNAETGDKQAAASLEELKKQFPEIWKSTDKGENKGPETKDGKVMSPDKQWVAYVRDNNVYISSSDGKQGKEVALSMDGTFDCFYSAGLTWSPDSKKIATLKTRQANCRRIPLLESAPESQLQPLLHWRNYAKPGDELPVSVPVLFDVEQRKQIPLDTRLYEYQFSLSLTGWREDSRAFTFEFNRRGHQRYIVGEVNAVDGVIRHLADEKSDTFISYINNYRFDLNDGAEMLWMSERDGWRHIYRIDGKTGEVKNQVTRGEWVVRKVIFVDTEQQKVYFMASGLYKKEDPYNQHYCSVKFDGTDFRDLTPEDGNHKITLSKDRTYFVDVYSRPDLPSVSVLRKVGKKEVIATLEKCDVTDLVACGWQMPEVFCAKGRDGKTDIWGTIYRPFNFDPSKSYPVIEDIYAGPHDSYVQKDFNPITWCISSLAEQGYIVVKIDGMGTNNRSKKFHDVCWKNLKDAGFPDRIKWIQAAARKYKYMDTSRVGIYGWSAGGQNAMAALLFHNDFYRAAVSFCGCHDNRMDKVWWNELWMGYPVDESYSRSSNVENAHLLKGDLLLINGELDDNVDPASTLQVVNALIKADKMFEQLYLPGKGHSLGGTYEIHRLYDFFNRKLNY
ncbi:S9 family peptidase [Bacteroides sp.]|uniref:S9 family peptidase n=1 Tax=Bacteroides sp. TaxID=29523 RepID=UPI0026317BC4|nr:S9 family peptidase [Bacteroides sp.]MDD3036576.1 prolyl oligopeptidase family serine peptidase [Bacteroides sp.]